jgi:putative transcriptional regulator
MKKKKKLFSTLQRALGDALVYEQGSAIDLRTTEIPAAAKPLRPREIKAIRRSLNASQVKFAQLLNVSPNTVESWEQGVRRPRHAALKLLAIAQRHPELLLEA